MTAAPEPTVVITGLGVVSPAGSTPDALWTGLLSGRSTARRLTHVDLSQHAVHIGCVADDADDAADLAGIPAKEARRTDPATRFGLTAALAAFADAGSPEPDPARGAVVAGTAVGGRWTSDVESRNFAERGPSGVHPLMPLMTMPNAAASHIAMRLGWQGPAWTVATTCASGADAVGQARMLLVDGLVDVVLAGGCECTLTPVSLAGFGNLNAVSTRNDEPDQACRPFDVDRDGFVMGEGAGFVVLEREADARARGARIHAVVAGYATTTDAYHLSMPRPDGLTAASAVTAAVADAGLEPAEIGHVNAHGTSTPHNDRAEAATLRAVFGPDGPPVTAPKGVLGHLIGAAGTVELMATVLAMNAGVVPPTANHSTLEPGMEIDVVHGSPRTVPVAPALSNSFGFGGHNSCLVVIPA